MSGLNDCCDLRMFYKVRMPITTLVRPGTDSNIYYTGSLMIYNQSPPHMAQKTRLFASPVHHDSNLPRSSRDLVLSLLSRK